MTNAPVVPIVLGGVVAWSIYRRVRRSIGWQRLRPRRILFSLATLSLFTGLFLLSTRFQPSLLLGLGGGLLPGALLGGLSLRLTRFETTDKGHFYKPNTQIGVLLSLLFIGRLGYRFWVLRDAAMLQNSTAMPHPPVMQSALTLFIFGLLAGHGIVYYASLFRHARDRK